MVGSGCTIGWGGARQNGCSPHGSGVGRNSSHPHRGQLHARHGRIKHHRLANPRLDIAISFLFCYLTCDTAPLTSGVDTVGRSHDFQHHRWNVTFIIPRYLQFEHECSAPQPTSPGHRGRPGPRMPLRTLASGVATRRTPRPGHFQIGSVGGPHHPRSSSIRPPAGSPATGSP